MKKILFTIILSSQFLFGQSDAKKISFEDYNKTTTVLIKLMEKQALKGDVSNTSIFLNSLLLLENEYQMKEKHKNRIRTFVIKNFKFNKPIIIDFQGISGIDPGVFVNNIIDPELFFEYLDLIKKGLSLDQLKNIQSLNKIIENSDLELKDINTIEIKENNLLIKSNN